MNHLVFEGILKIQNTVLYHTVSVENRQKQKRKHKHKTETNVTAVSIENRQKTNKQNKTKTKTQNRYKCNTTKHITKLRIITTKQIKQHKLGGTTIKQTYKKTHGSLDH